MFMYKMWEPIDPIQLLCHNVNQIINSKDDLRARNGTLYSDGVALYEMSYIYNYFYPTSIKETIELIKTTTLDYFQFIKGDLLNLDPSSNPPKLIIENIYQHHQLTQKLKKINEQFRQKISLEHESLPLDEVISTSELNHQTLLNKYLEKYNDPILNPEFEISPDIIIKRDDTLAASTVQKYVDSYCEGLDLQMVDELIFKGQQLVKSILEGTQSKLPENNVEAQLELAQLTWYFMKCGIDKSEGYYEGTFMIEDPEDKIFNFLNSNGHAYVRKSSHLKGRSSENHYGVDIFNQKMPAHKRTLLFARTTTLNNRNILFLKPENFSADITQVADSVLHAKELIVSQYNKIFYPGSDDLSNMRKERVPVNVIKNFELIVNFIEKNSETIFPELRENVTRWGISHMYRVAEELKKELSVEYQLQLKMFINYVKLTNFLKDFNIKISLKNMQISKAINALVTSENPIELVSNRTINLKSLFKILLEEMKFPEGLHNNRLNQIIYEMKGLDISDEKMVLPSDSIFIPLVNFYASLEAMDHLENRMGREVYLPLRELVSYRYNTLSPLIYTDCI